MNPPAPVTTQRFPFNWSISPIQVRGAPCATHRTLGCGGGAPYTRRFVRRRRPTGWARVRGAASPGRDARLLRSAAWVAVCAGIVLPLARRRLRLPPAASVAAVAAAPLGLTVAAARSRKRDTALYVLQMWAFIVIHELPYDDPTALEQRVRVEYPIAWDEVLGLGVQPTVRLQRILGRAGRATALDHALVYVHWAW